MHAPRATIRHYDISYVYMWRYCIYAKENTHNSHSYNHTILFSDVFGIFLSESLDFHAVCMYI